MWLTFYNMLLGRGQWACFLVAQISCHQMLSFYRSVYPQLTWSLTGKVRDVWLIHYDSDSGVQKWKTKKLHHVSLLLSEDWKTRSNLISVVTPEQEIPCGRESNSQMNGSAKVTFWIHVLTTSCQAPWVSCLHSYAFTEHCHASCSHKMQRQVHFTVVFFCSRLLEMIHQL